MGSTLSVARIKRFLIIGIALSCLAPALLPQTKLPTTIRTDTDLVLIPVFVTNKHLPVRDLKPEDFSVRESGQSRKIVFFEEVKQKSASPSPLLPHPDSTDNYTPLAGRSDLNILLLDFLNSSWSSRARILSSLSDMVAPLDSTPTVILLLTPDGLMNLSSAGTDSSKLRDTIQHWPAHNSAITHFEDPPQWASLFADTSEKSLLRGLEQAKALSSKQRFDLTDQAEATENAFEQIANATIGIKGPKKLIWVTLGPPSLTLEPEPRAESFHLDSELQTLASRMWSAMSAANVIVYTLDANGVTNPSWDEAIGRDSYAPSADSPAHLEVRTNSTLLLTISAKTGGLHCSLPIGKCIGRAVEDSKDYYILGFYLGRNRKPGWHSIHVTSRRKDASIRAREGFFVGELTTPQSARVDDDKTSNADVVTALRSPLDYTGLPLRLASKVTTVSESSYRVAFTAQTPPGGLRTLSDCAINVDLLLLIKNRKVESDVRSLPHSIRLKPTQQGCRELRTKGFQYSFAAELSPGEYEVRALLRDNLARHIGTVSMPLTLNQISDSKPSAQPAN